MYNIVIPLLLTVLQVTAHSTTHHYSGVIADTAGPAKAIQLQYNKTLRVMELLTTCTSWKDSIYLTVRVTNNMDNSDVASTNTQCNGKLDKALSLPSFFGDKYNLTTTGILGTNYTIKLVETEIDLAISSTVTLTTGRVAVRAIHVKHTDLETDNTAYARISVTSPNKTLTNSTTRNLGKLIVTNHFAVFQNIEKSNISIKDTLTSLTFSTFGAITLSKGSSPALSPGIWYIGLYQTGSVVEDKIVTIETQIVTDYNYVARIFILLGASFLGVIFPLISRVVFDYKHFAQSYNTKLKVWLSVIRGWFWVGNKGHAYLMALLLILLNVGAYQIVNAKWKDMIEYGDRDICYYNEKCYRPYGYSDISVNNCASNLPFVIHGLILILYFSFCEAYCKSVGHRYYDYSLPYAFGITFICEGIGSFLYHICPSKEIFQFDTMFMFMISVLQIVSIFEGYSVREHDIIYQYDTERAQKAVHPTKLFTFYVGPVYFFNFVGNIITTQGLSSELQVLFYTSFGIWLTLVLGWVAYKMGLAKTYCVPKRKSNPVQPEDGMILEAIFTPNKLTKIQQKVRYRCKAVLFIAFSFINYAGFIITMLHEINFSIYILGVLTIAVLVLTAIFFIPLMVRLISWVKNNHNGSLLCGGLEIQGTNQIVLIVVIIGYVAIGCVFSAVSLIFFTYFEATDKSIQPWLSRELNDDCFINDFYSAHDLWHLFASFSLMIMVLLNVQISKPCRECYISYLKNSDQHLIKELTWKYTYNKEGNDGKQSKIKTLLRGHITL